MKAKPTITIPRSELGAALADAATIKRDMTKLLEELETQAIRQAGASTSQNPAKPTKPGAWRQDPAAWSRTYLGS